MGKLPSEEECKKLLIQFGSVADVLKHLGKKYDTSKKMLKIARDNNIQLINANKRHDVFGDKTKEVKNNYMDNLELGFTFVKENSKWTIIEIYKKEKNMYLCQNKLGFKRCWYSIDIQERLPN